MAREMLDGVRWRREMPCLHVCYQIQAVCTMPGQLDIFLAILCSTSYSEKVLAWRQTGLMLLNTQWDLLCFL
jgi:hypothetical protein